MAVCTFFGHRDCPSSIDDRLRETVIDLITTYNVDTYYIGNHGNFDATARSVLRKLKNTYPHIKIYTVLAYLRDVDNGIDYGETILPEGFENVPPRFAIDYRNRWMVKHSDFIISFVTHNFGGAYKYTELARAKRKTVINISD